MSRGGTTYWNGGSVPLIAPEVLGDIIASASDLALVLSPEGRILSVIRKPDATDFAFADAWEGQDIRDCLAPDSVPKVDARLAVLAQDEAPETEVELNHHAGGTDVPLRYAFHRLGPDGTVLALGRDLRPVAEMQDQLVKAQLALEQDYETQRDFDTRYRVLMDSARDAILFVSLGSGRIVDANPAAAALLQSTPQDLSESALAQEFEGRRRGELLEALTNAALSESGGPLELATRRGGRRLRVAARAFRAAGERMLLLRLDSAEAGEESPADDLARDLSALYETGVDAIVFTDSEGVIRSANDAFLSLADSADISTVRGRSLGDFLSRGAVDLKVLLDNAARAGQMRMYSTRLVGEFGAQTAVEISATYLEHRAHPAMVFVLRDASRAEAMRGPAGPGVSDDAVRSVMELVGSATLKDIVAETTDVVEKMCIETAVELTRNNRVAAAEMLGLSRQSLYVKLRKYGLLNRDDS